MADGEDDALEVALEHGREAATHGGCEPTPGRIDLLDRLDKLRDGWTKDCVPYGCEDDATLEILIAEQAGGPAGTLDTPTIDMFADAREAEVTHG
ncbi:hypothetical protein WJ68_16140 [Burkholderia ubonensis]|uniref:Uncharacterized protein n=2 Tax=Burkholderia ubonensis TaxID=101571 RepID=A0ABD4E0X3_9BURK|nr:hypothetical protein WJ68_16140 [Burkholderia ubonensis]